MWEPELEMKWGLESVLEQDLVQKKHQELELELHWDQCTAVDMAKVAQHSEVLPAGQE